MSKKKFTLYIGNMCYNILSYPFIIMSAAFVVLPTTLFFIARVYPVQSTGCHHGEWLRGDLWDSG